MKQFSNRKKWLLGLGVALLAAVVCLVVYGVILAKGPGVDSQALELSAQPLDQPAPVPSSNQLDVMDDYCQLIMPGIAKTLNAAGKPLSIKGIIGGCDIPLIGGAWVQVSSVGPYGSFRTNKPHFAVVADVGGAEGRLYNLGAPLSGECTLQVNTRSFNSLTINVRWIGLNDLVRATKRTESCDIAKRTGEALVKAYMPRAGGHPYSKTLQQPLPSVIDSHPCRVVDSSAALYGDVFDVSDNASGKQRAREEQTETCTYEREGNRAVVRLDLGGKTLNDFPGQLAPEVAKNRTLGVLPARQAEVQGACSLAVELAPGKILLITYTTAAEAGNPCQSAEVMAAKAVYGLISLSSVPAR